LENFENHIFWQILNTNLNKILDLKKNNLKILKRNIPKIFPKKKSPKWATMVPINMTAPI
jgi:hypothetical protein